jgi:hypothetical protein
MRKSNLGYSSIKAIAKRTGIGVNDLLAMSAGNDPFYMGSKADIRNAEWFASLYHRAGRDQIHLRGLHYIAVSLEIDLPIAIRQDGVMTMRYLNTEEAWQFLVKASSAARWLDYVSFDSIVDNKNEATRKRFREYGQHKNPSVGFGLPDLDAIEVFAYTASPADVMPYYLCLFSEKSSVSYIVDPLAEQYHVDTQYFSGEFSHTAIYDLATRIVDAGRPAVLFVLSDFDAAGRSIAKSAARRLEYLVAQMMPDNDTAVVVQQVLLTKRQVDLFGLPFTPMKSSEKRADKFLEQMDVEGAVEIDAMLALHPDEFTRIIQDAFNEYSDPSKLREAAFAARRARGEARARLDTLLDKHKDTIAAAKEVFGLVERLAREMDMSAYMVERSGYTAVPFDKSNVIYNSDLDYIDQIVQYRQWEAGHDN